MNIQKINNNQSFGVYTIKESVYECGSKKLVNHLLGTMFQFSEKSKDINLVVSGHFEGTGGLRFDVLEKEVKPKTLKERLVRVFKEPFEAKESVIITNEEDKYRHTMITKVFDLIEGAAARKAAKKK